MKHCKPIFLSLLLLASLRSAAQQRIRFILTDSVNGESIPAVSIRIPGVELHSTTNVNGQASPLLPQGTWIVQFYAYGFQTRKIPVTIPSADTTIPIRMNQADQEKQEVIVSGLRTDSRIKNVPTRVEVLAAKEMEEESGVKPANIASLLGDVPGLQPQQTSAITGNTSIRIQGLPGDYTQLLRNGMPIFGGYSGNFSILQVPPLDLKQIEIIKGASSSLYGGGAIAGLINIISRKPVEGKKERYLLVNQSTLSESNLNLYLSERDKKIGYTFFSGGTYQKQADINRDGFSDVAATEQIFFHPVFYFYPTEKSTISVGLNSVFEERKGGDMQVLRNRPTPLHQFYIENQSLRNTLEATWDITKRKQDKLSFRLNVSNNKRDVSTNTFGMKARQLSFFSEAAYLRKVAKHTVVAGINFNGDRFRKGIPDSTNISDYRHFTAGLFIQDDWYLHPKLTLESGLRIDHHTVFGTFVLPRIAALYKINSFITTLLSGGMGYRVPAVFSNEADERNYRNLLLDENAKAERSLSFSWDLNFKKQIGETELMISQSFFLTRISDPLVAFSAPGSPPSFVFYYTAAKPVVTKGIETRVQLIYKKLEAGLWYTFTDARKQYDAAQPYLELYARDKLASVVSYEFSKNFRGTVEAAFTGKQYLHNGKTSPSYPFVACRVHYDIRYFSFILNCENLLDYRQGKNSPIINPPFTNPTFDQLWGPITGRVVNLSVKISW